MQETIARLFKDIPGLWISVLAHGDAGSTYVTKFVDLTSDQIRLAQFVSSVSA